VTRLHETVGFFDSIDRYHHSNQEVFRHIGPAALFYADRPMLAVINRAGVERWLRSGGVWLWAEEPDAAIVADLFDVAGKHGIEILFRRRGVAGPALIAQHICGV
jgi:hypothetical protein